jgi:hypothetical protein
MIKPIKCEKPYTPDLGDILYGSEYIEKEIKKEDIKNLNTIPICVYNGGNPWLSLINRFGIDATVLEEAVKYSCPYTDNHYYWFVPVRLVLRKNTITYYKKDSKDDYAYDIDWWKSVNFRMNTIINAHLGHGYTDGTLPYDGSGNTEIVLVPLDNGDALLGYCWFWYNK